MNNELIQFLILAKLNTYASKGDDASVKPVLNGSKQLEFSSGDFLYRDIYWGMSFFIGQEVVEHHNKPVWSMVYSGGTIDGLTWNEIKETYEFLRKALRMVSANEIYRGPSEYQDGILIYYNEVHGHFNNFSGQEIILKDGKRIYELKYSGGLVK